MPLVNKIIKDKGKELLNNKVLQNVNRKKLKEDVLDRRKIIKEKEQKKKKEILEKEKKKILDNRIKEREFIKKKNLENKKKQRLLEKEKIKKKRLLEKEKIKKKRLLEKEKEKKKRLLEKEKNKKVINEGNNRKRVKIHPKEFVLRHKLQKILSTGNWKVTFWKVNGEKRVMNCTRNFNFVSKNSNNWKSPKGLRKSAKNCIVVWDLDKNDWRCFRLLSIIQIEKNDGRLKKSMFKKNFSEEKMSYLYYNKDGLVQEQQMVNFSVEELTEIEFYPEDLFLELIMGETTEHELVELLTKLSEEIVKEIESAIKYYEGLQNRDEDEQLIFEGAEIVKKYLNKEASENFSQQIFEVINAI